MINCIDSAGNLHSQDPIPEGWTPCVEGDAAYEAALAALQARDIPRQQKAAAQALLDKSDVVLLRAQEDGLAFPDAWKSYRVALRIVVNAGGDLPTLPATYPDGTPTA